MSLKGGFLPALKVVSIGEVPDGWEMQILHPPLCRASRRIGGTRGQSAFLHPWVDH